MTGNFYVLLRLHGGGTDTEIIVSTKSRPWRRKFSRRSSRDSNPRPFNHESGALTIELSPPLLKMFKMVTITDRSIKTGNHVGPYTLNSKPRHHSSHINEHLRELHSTTTTTTTRKNTVWPWLARLIALFSGYRRATGQTLFHWFQFTDFIALVPVYSHPTCQILLHWFQFTAVPLVKLYFMVLIYSRTTGQTLLHWFQFTAVPLVRLYYIGCSLHPYHWSDFITLVPVYSRTTGQTLLYWFQLAVLTVVKLYFMVSVCSPPAWQTLFHWFQFTAVPLARFNCISISLQRCNLPDFIALF